jgi:hypothetical protein
MLVEVGSAAVGVDAPTLASFDPAKLPAMLLTPLKIGPHKGISKILLLGASGAGIRP